jgi:hypothetical protein
MEPTFSATQNPLQREFTEKTSPTNAAIIITEGIAEAKNNGKSIAITTLDTEKAFDKLVHDKLFCKLYDYNINDDNWMLIRQLQTQATTKVKLKGKSSKGFTTMQDIRQGAKLSPTLYKAYNNQLLNVLRDKKIGAMIGTTFIGCLTVADDIALIPDDHQDLQHALYVVQNETQKDKFPINASKSEVVLIVNSNRNREPQKWTLGNLHIKGERSYNPIAR